jgi:hypothetical protein
MNGQRGDEEKEEKIRVLYFRWVFLEFISFPLVAEPEDLTMRAFF